MESFFELSCGAARLVEVAPGREVRYAHRFGGATCRSGLVPKGGERPVTLLFELDLRDPVLEPLGVVFSSITRLPLLAALQYNCSDMVYRVASDRAVKIDFVSTPHEWYDDFPYKGFPGELPERPLMGLPLSPEERALAAAKEAERALGRTRLSAAETSTLDGLGHPWTQVGGRFPLMQGAQAWECASRWCAIRRLAGRQSDGAGETGVHPRLFISGFAPPVFMVCWEQPVAGFNLWRPGETERSAGFS